MWVYGESFTRPLLEFCAALVYVDVVYNEYMEKLLPPYSFSSGIDYFVYSNRLGNYFKESVIHSFARRQYM